MMPLSLRKHFFLTSGGLPCLLPLTPAIVLRYVCFLAGASPRLPLSLPPPMPTPRCRRCHFRRRRRLDACVQTKGVAPPSPPPPPPPPPSPPLRSLGTASTVNGLHGERRPPRRRPRRAPRGSAPRLARVSRSSINQTHTRSHHAPRRRDSRGCCGPTTGRPTDSMRARGP